LADDGPEQKSQEVRPGEQARALSLRLKQSHSLLIETDELFPTEPRTLVGDDAVGKISTRVEKS
jgi:hypothetical protein